MGRAGSEQRAGSWGQQPFAQPAMLRSESGGSESDREGPHVASPTAAEGRREGGLRSEGPRRLPAWTRAQPSCPQLGGGGSEEDTEDSQARDQGPYKSADTWSPARGEGTWSGPYRPSPRVPPCPSRPAPLTHFTCSKLGLGRHPHLGSLGNFLGVRGLPVTSRVRGRCPPLLGGPSLPVATTPPGQAGLGCPCWAPFRTPVAVLPPSQSGPGPPSGERAGGGGGHGGLEAACLPWSRPTALPFGQSGGVAAPLRAWGLPSLPRGCIPGGEGWAWGSRPHPAAPGSTPASVSPWEKGCTMAAQTPRRV